MVWIWRRKKTGGGKRLEMREKRELVEENSFSFSFSLANPKLWRKRSPHSLSFLFLSTLLFPFFSLPSPSILSNSVNTNPIPFFFIFLIKNPLPFFFIFLIKRRSSPQKIVGKGISVIIRRLNLSYYNIDLLLAQDHIMTKASNTTNPKFCRTVPNHC